MQALETHDPCVFEKLAGEATQRGDWSTAERCWRDCIATLNVQAKPDWYREHGLALGRLGRLDEADKVFAALRARWPRNVAGWAEGARSAAAQKDWPQAAHFWRHCTTAMAERGRVNWWRELARALIQQELYDEADEVCRAAQTRFPAESDGWEIAAKIAATRGEWARCGKAWESAAERLAPEAAFGPLQYGIRAYIACGLHDDAARLREKQNPCTPAAKRIWLYTGFDLLMAEGDIRGALAFWDAHEEPFEFVQAVAADQMVETAYEAGLEPSQAIDSLSKWMPREDAVRAVDGKYVSAKVAVIASGLERRGRSVLRLRALRLARRWPDYYQALSDLIESYWIPAGPTCVNAIAACPDPAIREAFLERLRNRLEDISPMLSGRQAETYLALLYHGRQPDKLATAHSLLRDRLGAPAAEFFCRAIAGEHRRPSVLGLGLSKTGTTSQHEYLEQLGLLSAHWSNPLTGHILDQDDAMLFDAVNDVPVTLLAMRNGVDPEQRIIVTSRDFASWEASIMAHYAQYFDRGVPSFERYREEFYGGEQFAFGQPWYDINHELYFCHDTLREAYDCHSDWIAGLEKRVTMPMLHLPLEAKDKAERISRYLGDEYPILRFPYANARKTSADGQASS